MVECGEFQVSGLSVQSRYAECGKAAEDTNTAFLELIRRSSTNLLVAPGGYRESAMVHARASEASVATRRQR